MKEYCLVQINSPSFEEAKKISEILLEKHLIAGANTILKTPAMYWWKGKIEEQEYCSIMAYSKKDLKNEIIAETRKIHSDECPAIVFIKIDANEDFIKWIEEYTK